MGFALDLVDSDAGHYSEFVCSICQCLPDDAGAVITTCHHVFCGPCLRKWHRVRSQKTTCPSCNRALPTDKYFGYLRTCNPLAWRILARLRVRCPLRVNGCAWRGEFSELQTHLTMSDAHTGGNANAAAAAADGSTNGAVMMEEVEEVEEGCEVDMEFEADPDPSSSPSSTVPSAEVVRSNAVSLKQQGTAKYEARRFAEALCLYVRALEVLEAGAVDDGEMAARLLCNGAACHLALRQYGECASLCRRALHRDPGFFRAWSRLARALTHLGEFERAVEALQKACELAPDNTALAADLVTASDLQRQFAAGVRCIAAQRFADARRLFSDLMANGSAEAPAAVLGLARAELGLGLTDRALRLTLRLLRSNPRCVDAWRVRGRANVMAAESGDAGLELLKSGSDAFKEALRLAPDNDELKREWRAAKAVRDRLARARQSHYARDFAGAVSLLTEALTTAVAGGLVGNEAAKSPLRATLHAERATALVRLKRHEECLEDTAIALACRPDCRAAILARASALHALERHATVRFELEKLLHTESPFHNDSNIRHAYEQAVFEIRKAERTDYYKLLEIPRTAVDAEIRTGYRQQSLQWHPDKWSGSQYTDVQRQRAAEHFKLLGEALEILSEPMKRQLYDEGYDRKAIDERHERAQRAARESESERGGRHHHHHHG